MNKHSIDWEKICTQEMWDEHPFSLIQGREGWINGTKKGLTVVPYHSFEALIKFKNIVYSHTLDNMKLINPSLSKEDIQLYYRQWLKEELENIEKKLSAKEPDHSLMKDLVLANQFRNERIVMEKYKDYILKENNNSNINTNIDSLSKIEPFSKELWEIWNHSIPVIEMNEIVEKYRHLSSKSQIGSLAHHLLGKGYIKNGFPKIEYARIFFKAFLNIDAKEDDGKYFYNIDEGYNENHEFLFDIIVDKN
jgi:hypothetical protein